MTDWQKEAQVRQDDYLKDLATLLAVKSVRDDQQATSEAPLGPGPKQALDTMLAIAERDGFRTKNIDNIVGYIEIGPEDSQDYVALLSHIDVMPAGEGWETDPFQAKITEDKVIARGASDDKGPGMAAYYGFKIIRDLGLPLKHRVRLIFGTDEENDWTGMTRYFEVEPAPLLGFSPDAEYPIINGEKGNVQIEIKSVASNGGSVTLEHFEAGMRTNMVPGVARASLKLAKPAIIKDDFKAYLNYHPNVKGELKVDGQSVYVTLWGKQVHGAMPETGVNAGTYLASFLKQYDFGGDAAEFLNYLGGPAHNDTRGVKFGVDHTDEVMGALSMNVGIQKFVAQQEAFLNFNFRYPKGIEPEEILTKLTQATGSWAATVTIGGHTQVPHYVAPSDPLVQTLLNIYHEQTGLPAYDQVIGGGTYGRLMKRGVAFGALFPDSPDTMHQVNEFALISDLVRSISIYAQAIFEISALD